MLNINQNFDLKAPVFNFDRDYFNSVEELKAYDTSNVPNHFVTNVAGTLYQLTGGNWLPMISTKLGDSDNNNIHYTNIIDEYCWVKHDPYNNYHEIGVGAYEANTLITDKPSIKINNHIGEVNKHAQIGIIDDGSFGLSIENGEIGGIKMTVDKKLTDEEQQTGASPVNISLTNVDNSVDFNANGIVYKMSDINTSALSSGGLEIQTPEGTTAVGGNGLLVVRHNNYDDIAISLRHAADSNVLQLGNDYGFYIFRPADNTEGATIRGVESITAFSNPSATKVWATDGSTVNMPTKFSNLKNDSIYITGNKGETDAKFKIEYKDGDVSRSKLLYVPRHAGVGIPELALVSYDTSGHNLSQLRIRPDDNRDNGQYLIQVQNVIGDTINYVSTLATENVSLQNFKNNTSVDLKSDELDFYNDSQGEQIQLKVNKEGITKTNGKPTEVFATDGSTVDLSTYTNYFNGTTTADKLKAKAVEVTDNTNSVIVSPTGITATNGSATKVFATDGSIADILLKKSATGGYYIEGFKETLGSGAFAANSNCKASGVYSFAEGYNTKASGEMSHAEGNETMAKGLYAHSEGYQTTVRGNYSHAEGQNTESSGSCSHAEGSGTASSGDYSHAEGYLTVASGLHSHAEGLDIEASGNSAHAEGLGTIASGVGAHAQGLYNIGNKNAIHSTGIGNSTIRKNAEYIYAKTDEDTASLVDNPKNGYKYLIGVGGYDGISIDDSTYKSVQEVIADLTTRIEQLETKVKALEDANNPA